MRNLILILISLMISSSSFAAPAQVLIIRHAEKPEKPLPEGTELSEKGRKRAQALVGYFMNNPEVTKYGKPAALFAMQPKDENGSVRAIQTLTPLAQALSLPVLTPFKKNELKNLVSSILSSKSYNGKTVLICWEHKVIPDMASEFGVKPRPEDWPSSDFSTVYEINFNGEHVASFRKYPEEVKVSLH